MHWFFPKNDGGRESGLHDAGVETFMGNLDRYLARELIQNSLDARKDYDRPAHVVFEVLELPRSSVPGMDELRDALARCSGYWSDTPKVRDYFDEAAQIASGAVISALRVRDFNTTGVPGADNDRQSNWYHLVRSSGSSSKWGGEGGSFGIGKNAPLAASRVRSVLYSTKTIEGEVAFQGVSTLVTHLLADGAVAQPSGFLGLDRGAAVRIESEVPQVFRRSEPGLDITILEFPASETWEDDLSFSVLENFWPAIAFGDLRVSVGDQTIDKENLAAYMTRFSAHEGFVAHQYYRAFASPTHHFTENVQHLGECSMYMFAGDPGLPKRTAMVRTTGMVIYERQHRSSLVPFCAVFLCRDPIGNSNLRQMEPPRHDDWDPDHPERGKNRKIERAFTTFIRNCILRLVPVDDSKTVTVPDLGRFLPDDDGLHEDSMQRDGLAPREETLERSLAMEAVAGRRIDPNRQRPVAALESPEDDHDVTEAVDGEEDWGGPSGSNDSDGGTGEGVGDSSGAGRNGALSSEGGSQARLPIPIRFRTFSQGGVDGVYRLVVRTEATPKKAVTLQIGVVGDDQKSLATVTSAVDVRTGAAIPVVGPGSIGPLDVGSDESELIELSVAGTIRYSMEVSAYEA